MWVRFGVKGVADEDVSLLVSLPSFRNCGKSSPTQGLDEGSCSLLSPLLDRWTCGNWLSFQLCVCSYYDPWQHQEHVSAWISSAQSRNRLHLDRLHWRSISIAAEMNQRHFQAILQNLTFRPNDVHLVDSVGDVENINKNQILRKWMNLMKLLLGHSLVH